MCAKQDKIPASLGIDTWGVDFVLLDEKDQVLGDTVAYRDSRTEGMDEEVYKLISPRISTPEPAFRSRFSTRSIS